MDLFVHNDRHVVEVTGDEVDGKVPVRWVGLSPSVEGVKRRGRPPAYAKPVPMSELTRADETVVAAFTASDDSENTTEASDETPADDASSEE